MKVSFTATDFDEVLIEYVTRPVILDDIMYEVIEQFGLYIGFMPVLLELLGARVLQFSLEGKEVQIIVLVPMEESKDKLILNLPIASKKLWTMSSNVFRWSHRPHEGRKLISRL
jgi:hypothetical protein